MKGKNKILTNRYLYWLQILTNWFFQGITHADKTEKVYKILFTLILSLLIGLLIWSLTHVIIIAFVIGFIVGHTLNWSVNCNFHVLLIHRLKWTKILKEDYFKYLFSVQQRLTNKNWLLYSVCMGSICEGKLNNSSDIDISIIRKPGFKNALSAIIFFVKEKKYADFKRIPLDLFIIDNPINSIKRSNYQKKPIILSDADNTIDKYYNEKLTIAEAKKLNNI